jgi:transcription elongation factor GreA
MMVPMSDTQMTAEDLETLKAELYELESNGRAQIAARIKTAREWGDLKENAEYHEAKRDQSHLETRILQLRDRIQNAEVVEEATSTDIVRFGSTVTFTDAGTGREQTFKIVSAHEAKPTEGTLSVASPIASALLERRVGDTVKVPTPTGQRELRLTAIG